MAIVTIARLTLREAARRRLLLAVVLLTLVVVGLTGWGFSTVTPTDEQGRLLSHSEALTTDAAILILIAYMFSVVLALGAAFLAAPSIATDAESGLLLAMLPRPIRRSDVLLGKWLGLGCLLALYAIGASVLELGAVRAISGYLPPHPLLAVLYLIGQSLVMLSLGLLLSTRLSPVTGGVVVLVVYGVTWLAGIMGVIGADLGSRGLTAAGTIIGLIVPSDAFWRGAVYNLEPAALIAVSHGVEKNAPFMVSQAPQAAWLIWSAGWVAAVLCLAAFSFGRRDL
jgi:ABC-type transport system involved in multi-copper enzyme maturation permease subunit